MNYEKFLNTSFFPIYISLIVLILYLIAFFQIKCVNPSDELIKKTVVSLQAQDEKLINILEKISNSSGYIIVVNTELGDSQISIQLRNVSVQEAVKRVLQNYNHIAIWDEEKKKLVLHIFDDKGLPVSISGKQTIFEPATKTITE